MKAWSLGFGFRNVVWSLGFRVSGLGVRLQASGLRVYGAVASCK